jgi:hypothetical protein
MSKETVGTIGDQKSTMPCANMTEAEFVKEVTDGLLPPPAYFEMNVNKAELKVLKRFSINESYQGYQLKWLLKKLAPF